MSACQIGSGASKSGRKESQRYRAFDRVSASGKQLYGYYTDVRVSECGIVCRLLYRTSGGPAKEGTNLAIKGSICYVYPHILISSTGIQRAAPTVLRDGSGSSVPRVYFAGTLIDRVATVRNGEASKFNFQVSIPGPIPTRVRCTCLRASRLITEAPRLLEGHYVAIVGYLGEQPGGMLDVVVVSFACLIYPEDIVKRARVLWPGREGGDEVRVVGFYLPVNETSSDDDAEGSTEDEGPDGQFGRDREAPPAARPPSKVPGTASAIMFPGTPADTPARIMPAQLAVVHTTQAYSSALPTAQASPSSLNVSTSTLAGTLASPGPSFDPDAHVNHPAKVEHLDTSSMMIVAAPYAAQSVSSAPNFGHFPNANMQPVPIIDDAITTTHPAVVEDTSASQSSLYGALGPTFDDLQSPGVGDGRMDSELGGDGMDVDPPHFAATASLGFAVDGLYADLRAAELAHGLPESEPPGSLLFSAATADPASNLSSSPRPPIAALEPPSWDSGSRTVRHDASLTPSPITNNVDIAEASLAADAPAELFSGPEDLPSRPPAAGGGNGANGSESFSDIMHDAFDHYRWVAENGPDDLASTMVPDELFDTYLDHD